MRVQTEVNIKTSLHEIKKLHNSIDVAMAALKDKSELLEVGTEKDRVIDSYLFLEKLKNATKN